MPIAFQQTNRPVPVVYSLNTEFQLCNNEKVFMMDPATADVSMAEMDYKGAFSMGMTGEKQNVSSLNSPYSLQNNKLHCWLTGFFCYSSRGSERNPVSLLPPVGQTLYGRVLWNPEQNLNAAYKLQLEKVYLCTGRDGYVPFFDPTGTLYNEGPQYGCIQPNKHLKHRFLLLV